MAFPTMTPVQSGHITGVGHDGETAYVQFKSGAVYRYHGVSADLFKRFTQAESKGAFFNSHLKACPCERHGQDGQWATVAPSGAGTEGQG